GFVRVDPNNPNTVYFTYAHVSEGRFLRSDDGGTTAESRAADADSRQASRLRLSSRISGKLAEKTRRRELNSRRRALTRVAGSFEIVSSSPNRTRNCILRVNTACVGQSMRSQLMARSTERQGGPWPRRRRGRRLS